MNYLVLNNNLLSENDLRISADNRAFCYGDGLFETMIFRNNKLLYLDDHFARLTEGLQKLDIRLPNTLAKTTILEQVSNLAIQNGLNQSARVKLHVWRKSGGLVTPMSSEADYLLTASALTKPVDVKKITFTSEDSKLHASTLSRYKTLNFLPYILSGIEKKRRNADELILTDYRGYIAEATSSNLFWSIAGVLFTPALETGCIDGIMRKQIIRLCKSMKINVIEGLFTIEELKKAECVFTSTISGLSLLETINDFRITSKYSTYQAIQKGLFLDSE